MQCCHSCSHIRWVKDPHVDRSALQLVPPDTQHAIPQAGASLRPVCPGQVTTSHARLTSSFEPLTAARVALKGPRLCAAGWTLQVPGNGEPCVHIPIGMWVRGGSMFRVFRGLRAFKHIWQGHTMRRCALIRDNPLALCLLNTALRQCMQRTCLCQPLRCCMLPLP